MNVTIEMFAIMITVASIVLAMRWYLDPEIENNPEMLKMAIELQKYRQDTMYRKTERIRTKIEQLTGFFKKHRIT